MRAPIQTQNRAKVLRKSPSLPERTLWAMLRGNQQGMHFRRQHAVGVYILDFYCATARLCVEVDGPSHQDRAEYDARRTKWLNEQGIRVLRFFGRGSGTPPDGGHGRHQVCGRPLHRLTPVRPPPLRGRGFADFTRGESDQKLSPLTPENPALSGRKSPTYPRTPEPW
jgi:very-short-patch-repair endonuclease